jgi:hypothetical protein
MQIGICRDDVFGDNGVPLCISYTDADSGLLFAGMYETR